MKSDLLLFLSTIVFLSCNSKQPLPTVVRSKVPLDTVKTIPANTNAFPALLETAFLNGTVEVRGEDSFHLYGVNIGKLKVPSGKIIYCDPLHLEEYGIPYTQIFPTGEFPVHLSIATKGQEEVIAFARIFFSESPVVKWEMALREDQEPLPIEGRKVHTYGVDAGVVIFLDSAAVRSLSSDSINKMSSPLFKQMEANYRIDWEYAMYNFGVHNLAGLTTGVGDGQYPSYIGYDASGKPCRLVTDFRIIEWRR